MKKMLLSLACLSSLSLYALGHEPNSETERKSHDVELTIQVSCPPSEEFKQFMQSIPSAEYHSANFTEWKSTFINTMNHLIYLIESEKVSNSFWSARTDSDILENLPLQKDRAFYDMAYVYVDCCFFTLSSSQFTSLLQDEVSLFHQTNEEPPLIAHGKKEVSELFKKYVFNNTSSIELKSYEFRPEKDGVTLKIVNEEEKQDDFLNHGRFHFEEITTFQFSEKAPFLITSIHTHVQKKRSSEAMDKETLTNM